MLAAPIWSSMALIKFIKTFAPSQIFTEVCQNLLVVDLVNGDIQAPNPREQSLRCPPPQKREEDYSFRFRFALPCLFLLLVNWNSSSAWIGTFFLGTIEKNHDSSQVIVFSKKTGPVSMFWRMSAQIFSFSPCILSIFTIITNTCTLFHLTL